MGKFYCCVCKNSTPTYWQAWLSFFILSKPSVLDGFDLQPAVCCTCLRWAFWVFLLACQFAYKSSHRHITGLKCCACHLCCVIPISQLFGHRFQNSMHLNNLSGIWHEELSIGNNESPLRGQSMMVALVQNLVQSGSVPTWSQKISGHFCNVPVLKLAAQLLSSVCNT